MEIQRSGSHPPARGRPSILPVLCALTPCFRQTIRPARPAPVSLSSPALGRHGTPPAGPDPDRDLWLRPGTRGLSLDALQTSH